jgi:hypothetical protein
MFRETTVSLDDLAAEIRDERIPELKAERQAYVDDVAADLDDAEDPRPEHERQFERFNQQIRAAEGTAQSLEHYADAAGDDDEFHLRELNADQFAAVLDTVDQAGTQQRRAEGDLPKGVGMVESLKRGVVAVPEGFDSDPGAWPAALVQVLHGELDDLTTADESEVELGNESLADALADR